MNGLEEPLYWQIEDGRYLGLYTAEDVYIYLGEMENGFRAGSGFWYREYHWESGYGATLYTGNWSDDYPTVRVQLKMCIQMKMEMRTA